MALSKADQHYLNLKIHVGKQYLDKAPIQIHRDSGVTTDFVHYHGRKFWDPTFHPLRWGGARHCAFSDFDQECIEGTVTTN